MSPTEVINSMLSRMTVDDLKHGIHYATDVLNKAIEEGSERHQENAKNYIRLIFNELEKRGESIGESEK